jgi:membrane protease YdiL (CAAX protease family)
MCLLDIGRSGPDQVSPTRRSHDGTVTSPAPAPTTPPLPADAYEGGLPFHRLVFARRRTGWWTPLVVGLLGVALYVAMIAVILVGVVIVTLIAPEVTQAFLTGELAVQFDLTDPLLIAFLLGSIALMLPAYVLASLIVNGRRVGYISSAMGRLRWRWMLVCGAAAVVVGGLLTAVTMFIPQDAGDTSGIVAPADNPQLWATFAVLLLIVPLQAAAEEYVFRGYLMQAIGRWLRHPLFAILLPVPLFVLGHLYDPLGQASVAVFAVAAGWLTWRTGGLEAAIALHVVNNLIAFLLGLAGLSDVNASSPGVLSFVYSTVLVGAFCGVVEVLFRRARLGRTVVFPRPVPSPVYQAAATPSASRIV